MKYLLLFIHCSLFTALAGCNDKPSDVPVIFPCSVIVKNGAEPIADATVLFGSNSAGGAVWTVSGVTNSNGVAVMHTKRLNWHGSGAPAGEYIAAVSKDPKMEGGLSAEEIKKLDPDEFEKYQIKQQREYDKLPREIPVQLSDFSLTPFKLTVAEGQENKLEVDISEYKPKK